MSIRLTKHIRQRTAEAVAEAKFDQRIKDAHDRVASCGEALFDTFFTGAQHDLMDSLPAGWLMESSTFYILIEGTTIKYSVDLPQPRRMPSYLSYSAPQTVTGKEPEYKAWRKAKDEVNTLTEEKEEARQRVRMALAEFTNVNELQQRWPEILQYVPSPEAKRALLPAPAIASINAELGLP